MFELERMIEKDISTIALCTTSSGTAIYFHDFIKDLATIKDIPADQFVGYDKDLPYGLKLVLICTPKMIDLFEQRKEGLKKPGGWSLPECLFSAPHIDQEITDEVCRMIHRGKTVK